MMKLKNVIQGIGILSVMLLSLILSCHAQATQAMTQKILRPLILQQCQQELKNSKAWQVSVKFMATAKREKVQQQICGCVSDHAMDQVSVKDLVAAGFSEERKRQLVRRVVLNSLKGCAEDLLH